MAAAATAVGKQRGSDIDAALPSRFSVREIFTQTVNRVFNPAMAFAGMIS
jgi:hypothetical protein